MMRTAILPILALFAFATAQGPVSATGKLAMGQASVKRGEAAKATIILDIPSGHHAYAPVGESDFIPVTVEGINGSSYTVKAYFPKGVSKTYPGLDHAVMAYEGKLSIPVKFFIPANHKTGKLVVKAVVGSQVCSNQTGVCYAPKKQMVTGTVAVR